MKNLGSSVTETSILMDENRQNETSNQMDENVGAEVHPQLSHPSRWMKNGGC
jgi:hypothetical protein